MDEVADMSVGACDSDAQKTSKLTQIQYIGKIFGIPVTMQNTVQLSQAQHTERIMVMAVVMQHQTPAIQTAQENGGGSPESAARSSGKRGFGDTADKHAGADADDVYATTESELAVSAGEAVDS